MMANTSSTARRTAPSPPPTVPPTIFPVLFGLSAGDGAEAGEFLAYRYVKERGVVEPFPLLVTCNLWKPGARPVMLKYG